MKKTLPGGRCGSSFLGCFFSLSQPPIMTSLPTQADMTRPGKSPSFPPGVRQPSSWKQAGVMRVAV